MNILLGTTSELKKTALEQVLNQYKLSLQKFQPYEIVCFDVESLVPDTPYGDQAAQGAINRARTLYKMHRNEGEFFVGLESGLVKRQGTLFEECWCCIRDKNGKETLGYSSGLPLPIHITEAMSSGRSHIEVLQQVASNIGITSRDTWSVYTQGALARIESVKEAFRNAALLV